MADGVIVALIGEPMEAHREGLLLGIGQEVDLRAVDGTEQTSCIVIAGHLLAQYLPSPSRRGRRSACAR